MGRLDDLEQPRFVDPGIRDDQLVERPARERGLDGARVALAGEVVVDAAAAGAERLAQLLPRLPVANGHRLAAHADRLEDRAGEQLVTRAEKADQPRDEQRTDDVEP